MTAAPAITAESIEEAKRREEESKRQRNLAIALAGGGAGLYGLSNLMLGPKSTEILRDFNATGKHFLSSMGRNPTFPQQEQLVRAYAEAGSKAMKAHAFGMPARNFIETLRSLPGMPASHRWHGDSSGWHYDAFAKGPLYGYAQVIAERVKDEKLFGGGGRWANRRRHDFQRDLLDRINNISREMYGRDAVPGARDWAGHYPELIAKGMTTLSEDQQRAVLNRVADTKKFTGGWMSPIFSNRYREAIEKTTKVPREGFTNYGQKIGEPVIKAKNILAGTGLALGGAGLGLGAWYLWKKRQEAKKRRAAEAAKNTRNPEIEPVTSAAA